MFRKTDVENTTCRTPLRPLVPTSPAVATATRSTDLHSAGTRTTAPLADDFDHRTAWTANSTKVGMG